MAFPIVRKKKQKKTTPSSDDVVQNADQIEREYQNEVRICIKVKVYVNIGKYLN